MSEKAYETNKKCKGCAINISLGDYCDQCISSLEDYEQSESERYKKQQEFIEWAQQDRYE